MNTHDLEKEKVQEIVGNHVWAYDLETYPNFFSAIFVNANDPDEVLTFVYFKKRNDIPLLIDFLESEPTLIGFNNLRFDDIILNAILMYPHIKPKNLNNLGQKIISNEELTIPNFREIRYYNKPYTSLDVMMIKRLHMVGVSLKQAAITIQHEWIQELPIEPNTNIKAGDVDDLLKYNLNDVVITLKLFYRILGDLELRKDVSQRFGVDVMNANDSSMAKEILTAYLVDAGYEKKTLLDMRSARSQVAIKDCIGKNLQFDSPKLKSLLDELEDTLVTQYNRFKFKRHIEFRGVGYDVGIGGLHSKDGPNIYSADSEKLLIHSDVSSYYPSIMLINNIRPEHLGDNFTETLSQITEERLQAKKEYGSTKDPITYRKQAALKITINSIFGRLGSEYSYLQDEKALISVTVSGQLYLLDLIEKISLYGEGSQVLSANTDGIICYVPKDKEDLYLKICKNWQERIGLGMDHDYFSKFIQRDVNNYVAIFRNGKIKTKGVFDTELHLIKGYSNPIVSKGLYNYFVNGISAEETVNGSTNIHDFLKSPRVGKQFYVELVKPNLTREKQQRVNRFFVTFMDQGGTLRKVRKDTEETYNLAAGQSVCVVNMVKDLNPDKYAINRGWYIKEITKIIDLIEPRMVPLF